ncbi:TadE family protein [Streptacidiphilus sp. N1-10]|uniref:TadE family protein n=1 Tax=Streptacidiphilus jeojiensis TaxID=3229225 RepID=A0ABV6XIB1_9ACTN
MTVPRLHPALGGSSSDRGASAVELAMITPLLMLVLLGFVQFALAEYAHHIAQAAAVRALATAREQDSSAAAGRASGQDALAQLAGGVLEQPTVTVTRETQVATVQVSGQVTSLIPGLHLRVTAHDTGPVEKYEPVPPGR